MKLISVIGAHMGLNPEGVKDFTDFLIKNPNINVSKASFMQGGGLGINEYDEARAIQLYNEELERRRKRASEKAAVLISSGFSFEGYKITKYSGYISGDDTIQIPRDYVCSSYNPQALCDALVKIRIQALSELKDAALALGCNAVIGVDFDYMTFEPESASFNGNTVYYPYVICVTANGNAVVIEKE